MMQNLPCFLRCCQPWCCNFQLIFSVLLHQRWRLTHLEEHCHLNTQTPHTRAFISQAKSADPSGQKDMHTLNSEIRFRLSYTTGQTRCDLLRWYHRLGARAGVVVTGPELHQRDLGWSYPHSLLGFNWESEELPGAWHLVSPTLVLY